MNPRMILVVAVLALAGCPATCQSPTPGSDGAADAAAPPAPVAHADCQIAADHYAVVCASSDSETTASLCKAVAPNKPGYPDCLATATSCDDGPRCDNAAGISHGPRPVNGH